MTLFAEIIVIMTAALMPILLTAVFVMFRRYKDEDKTIIMDDTIPVTDMSDMTMTSTSGMAGMANAPGMAGMAGMTSAAGMAGMANAQGMAGAAGMQPVPGISAATWRPRPVWYLELMNMNSGLRIGKRFQESLTLGRFVGTGEQHNMLYLDRSNTISRKHVKVTIYDSGVAVENLSSVNIARLNGKALVYPDWLRYQDQLQVGDETYIVTAINRVA